jgi:2',3'-cyclic-nucleotide 2'-phosphodiesterase (5'-nucleotidase family)
MKKQLFILLIFVLLLSGCIVKDDTFSEKTLEAFKIEYVLGNYEKRVTTDIGFKIPENIDYEYEIISDKTDVIKIDGNKGIVTRQDMDATVIITFLVSKGELEFSKKITLTVVKRDLYEYTVTFDYNQNNIQNTSVKVKENNKVEKPENPSIIGFNFLGWYLEDELYDFNNIVLSDLTLVAKYEIIPFYSISELKNLDINTDFETSYGIVLNIEDNQTAVLRDLVTEDTIILDIMDIQFNYKPFDIISFGGTFTKNYGFDYVVNLEVHSLEGTKRVSFVEAITNISELSSEHHGKYISTKLSFVEKEDANTFVFTDGIDMLGIFVDTTKVDVVAFLEELKQDDLVIFNKALVKYEGLPSIVLYNINNIFVLGSTTVDAQDIYYINDMHGGLLKEGSQIGLANMANVILNERKTKDVTFLAGGDILQGQIISNHYQGSSTIDILGQMGLDAFVVGNHEFDWGFDTVLQYFNGEHELQASFPLLGANLTLKSTGLLPNGVDPYTILYKNGKAIGVIGVIGYGLESSIDAELVKDYRFLDPIPIVKNWVTYLKETEYVDHIIVINHDDDDYFNSEVAIEGVDAIFNGHSHQEYTKTVKGKPVMQSGANGWYLGHLRLNYNVDKNAFSSFVMNNLTPYDDSRLNTSHPDIQSVVDYYYDPIKYMFETIVVSDNYYSQDTLTSYIAKTMLVKTDSDVAIHNSGGTRASIYSNEAITEAKILQIFPFDNLLVTLELSGKDLKSQSYGTKVYKDGIIIEDNKMYKVVTHTYIFNYDGFNPLKNGTNVIRYKTSLKDVLTEAMYGLKENGYTTFNVNHPIFLSLITESDKLALYFADNDRTLDFITA